MLHRTDTHSLRPTTATALSRAQALEGGEEGVEIVVDKQQGQGQNQDPRTGRTKEKSLENREKGYPKLCFLGSGGLLGSTLGPFWFRGDPR